MKNGDNVRSKLGMMIFFFSSMMSMLNVRAQESSAPHSVNMLEIFRSPHEFHGKTVTVVGIIGFTSAGIFLYPSQQSYDGEPFDHLLKIDTRGLISGKKYQI